MYPGAHATTSPDKPAVIMCGSGQTLTYRELEDRSAALARVLHDRGLRTGDVIAMVSDNRPEALEIYWAAIRSGLYITAVNYNLSAEEIGYIVDDCEAKAVLVSAGLSNLAEHLVSFTPDVKHRIAFAGVIDGHEDYEAVLASAGEPLEDMPRGGDMLYSSGTTGRPKGVKTTLLPLQVNEPGDPFVGLISMGFGVVDSDIYLSTAPIYHAAPLRWSATVQAVGGTVVMMEKFQPEQALEAIARHKVTVLQVVPTMFVRMLQLPEATRAAVDLSTVRMAVHAAAPCPPDVKEAMIEWWGPILVEYYGSTEGNGVTIISSDEWVRKRGSVGRSLLGPIHICDDDGNELPLGEVGNVYFERESLPFRYHNDPEKTAAAQHPTHPAWTAVGDLGYLDDEGYLFLTDRKAFMIISGGVNIYPQEVENVLTLHPAVHDVGVIGIPDPEFGEQVKAVIQVREGHEPTEALAQELIEYVRGRIAHFKAPRSVDFVDEMPRTPTGKLIKGELLNHYRVAATQEVEA